jgi:hypothetical protein
MIVFARQFSIHFIILSMFRLKISQITKSNKSFILKGPIKIESLRLQNFSIKYLQKCLSQSRKVFLTFGLNILIF